ncbi:hypothetical protein C0Q88_07515 [Ralstonia pickettii]|uniref:Uncharacterized protein n=1 Tax=Ralstonia pickettii TaxID=329 RepID=A0A2N4TXV7_RALPI|nr:hypothetical protein [Ralstonia pickettii]PLC44518.1 hypothetical protein C0Q88_07515 [Ralstonia pickettii]
MDNTTKKECRSSYCECEPGKCGSGRIDKRGEAAAQSQALAITKGERDGNWQEFDVNGHGGLIRVVARIEGDDADLPLGKLVEDLLVGAGEPRTQPAQRPMPEPTLADAIAFMRRLKQNLMHARRFGSDTLQAYRNACVRAEGDVEEWLIEHREAARATSAATVAEPSKIERVCVGQFAKKADEKNWFCIPPNRASEFREAGYEVRSAFLEAAQQQAEPSHADSFASKAAYAAAIADAQQAEPGADERAASDAYDKVDRFLRNNLDDVDYAEYSEALESVRVAQSAQHAGDDHNPVEAIGAEFVKAKASRDPRAVDTLVDALGCTLREQGFALIPLDEEEVSES